jgi:WD40 repeat protein
MTSWRILAIVFTALMVMSAERAHAQDTLRIVQPAGGEVFYIDRDTIDIVWTGIDDTSAVLIEYSVDGGVSWVTIADSARGLLYRWFPRNPTISSNYRIRVTLYRPPLETDDVVYQRHFSDVVDGTWSPSGARIVTAGQEPHVWNSKDGAQLNVMNEHVDRVNAVDWNRDSSLIVTASDDSTVRVYDAATYQFVRALPGHRGNVTHARFDRLGTSVATACTDGRVRIFNVQSGTGPTFPLPFTINHIAWSPASNRLVVCSDDTVVRIYNATGGLPLPLAGHTFSVVQAAFSPDGRYVLTAGGDATARIWDGTSGAQLFVLSDPREGVRCVAWSPNGAHVFVGMSDSTVIMFDATTGQRVRTFGGHRAGIVDVDVSADGKLITTASEDNNARVFAVEDGSLVRLMSHSRTVRRALWSPDDGRVLTTSEDGTARVWQIRQIPVQQATSVGAFSIAPAPPGSLQIHATGDTIFIGDEFDVVVSLRDAQNLDLVGADSLTLTFTYDGTIAWLLTKNDVASMRDSSGYTVVRMRTLPMPTGDQELFTLRFRATLGADSLTSFLATAIVVQGASVTVRTDAVAQPILVRGQCRVTADPRLYVGSGSRLQTIIAPNPVHDVLSVMTTLRETGFASFVITDLFGREMYRTDASPAEVTARAFDRSIDCGTWPSGQYVLRLSTPTNTRTVIIDRTGGR